MISIVFDEALVRKLWDVLLNSTTAAGVIYERFRTSDINTICITTLHPSWHCSHIGWYMEILSFILLRFVVFTATMFRSGVDSTMPSALACRTTPNVPSPASMHSRMNNRCPAAQQLMKLNNNVGSGESDRGSNATCYWKPYDKTSLLVLLRPSLYLHYIL